MQVRAATLDDWADVSAFIEAMNLERVVAYAEPDYTKLHLATVHAVLLRDLGGVFVADDENGNLIGYAAFVRFPEMPEGMAEGVGTYVLPEARRTKVAHELGVAAYRFLREAYGVTVLRGTAYLSNTVSVERCKAEGARIVGYLLEYDVPAEG